MDEHLTNIIEAAIRDYRNDGDKAREQHLMECFVSQAVTDAGYRLDPCPNGKTKGEFLDQLETTENVRDRARNFLHEEHARYVKEVFAVTMEHHRELTPDCRVCKFLLETSLVKA